MTSHFKPPCTEGWSVLFKETRLSTSQTTSSLVRLLLFVDIDRSLYCWRLFDGRIFQAGPSTWEGLNFAVLARVLMVPHWEVCFVFFVENYEEHLQAQCIGHLVSTFTHLCPSGLAEMAMGTCSSIVHKIKSWALMWHDHASPSKGPMSLWLLVMLATLASQAIYRGISTRLRAIIHIPLPFRIDWKTNISFMLHLSLLLINIISYLSPGYHWGMGMFTAWLLHR